MLRSLSLFRAHLTDSLSLRPRRIDRRLAHVARDPRLATCDDVELLIRAHGLSETKVGAVVDRLARGKVDPTLAWVWTLRRDGGELAEVCDLPITDRQLVAHLTMGPRPAHVGSRGAVS